MKIILHAFPFVATQSTLGVPLRLFYILNGKFSHLHYLYLSLYEPNLSMHVHILHYETIKKGRRE